MDNNKNKIDNFNLSYYYDHDKTKTINDIEKIDFKTTKPSQFSMGFKSGNNWFKFEVENKSDTQNLLIYFSEPFFGTLNLYEYKDNKWKKYKDGISARINQKETKGRNPAFNVTVKKGEVGRYYLEASTLFPTFGEIKVYKEHYFLSHDNVIELALYMLYFGGLLIIILFNIILYLMLKDSIYIYYMGYTFFYMMFVFALGGFNNLIGLENYYYELHVSAPFLMMFITLFTNKILEINKYSKNLNKIFKIMAAIFLILAILVFIDIQRWYPVVTEIATFVFLTILLSTLYIWLKGNSVAKYYFFVLSIYITCMVLFSSMANGWLENDDMTRYIFLYASFFEIIFFALLLANRFNNIYKEKILIQEKLINSLKDVQRQEKFIQQQSRLAQMGEMISMIAHQWRQPLGAISSAVFSTQTKISRGDKSSEELLEFSQKKLQNINDYVQFLSSTIDDFRNFFKPNKEKVFVRITAPIVKALQIVQASMESKGINISTEFETEESLYLYQNEMIQVILNILKNCDDNFTERDIINPHIIITTKKEKDDYVISVYDNGGGIDKSIIDNIFDPYFSTKDEKNGTGIGLYMSKVIIEEHNNGRLSVINTNGGVCFTIKLLSSNTINKKGEIYA
jgi:signal transduction histidine kinase